MPVNPEPAIVLRGVRKTFGAKVAVNALDLDIPAGELFCLLGPNGAGKTTTLKMLCGLLRPTRGELRVAGFDAVRGGQAARQVLGYIPDTPFLYDRLTPAEFMEFIGDLYGLPPARVRAESARWFEIFGLGEHRDVLIKDLSHGLRQRVVYASTFLHEPRVLLVDEPFIGLDPFSIRLIKNLLRERARDGVTVVMTTHILALVEDLADRLGIIQRGELVALGTLQALLRQGRAGGRLEDAFLSITAEEA